MKLTRGKAIIQTTTLCYNSMRDFIRRNTRGSESYTVHGMNLVIKGNTVEFVGNGEHTETITVNRLVTDVLFIGFVEEAIVKDLYRTLTHKNIKILKFTVEAKTHEYVTGYYGRYLRVTSDVPTITLEFKERCGTVKRGYSWSKNKTTIIQKLPRQPDQVIAQYRVTLDNQNRYTIIETPN